jgi:hypothetical protein
VNVPDWTVLVGAGGAVLLVQFAARARLRRELAIIDARMARGMAWIYWRACRRLAERVGVESNLVPPPFPEPDSKLTRDTGSVN